MRILIAAALIQLLAACEQSPPDGVQVRDDDVEVEHATQSDQGSASEEAPSEEMIPRVRIDEERHEGCVTVRVVDVGVTEYFALDEAGQVVGFTFEVESACHGSVRVDRALLRIRVDDERMRRRLTWQLACQDPSGRTVMARRDIPAVPEGSPQTIPPGSRCSLEANFSVDIRRGAVVRAGDRVKVSVEFVSQNSSASFVVALPAASPA